MFCSRLPGLGAFRVWGGFHSTWCKRFVSNTPPLPLFSRTKMVAASLLPWVVACHAGFEEGSSIPSKPKQQKIIHMTVTAKGDKFVQCVFRNGVDPYDSNYQEWKVEISGNKKTNPLVCQNLYDFLSNNPSFTIAPKQ